MREIKYAGIKTHDENNRPLSLIYFVLVDKLQQSEHYGVKVMDSDSGEFALAPNLTTEAELIYDFVEKLAKNTVTPTTLADVVADWQAR